MTPAPDPNKIPKSQRRNPADSALDYVGLVNESVQAGFERLTAAQEKTSESMEKGFERIEVALVQLATQVKATDKNLDKLGEKLDKMGERIDGHLAIAQQQAKNIEHLSTLVATQARTVEVLINRGA
jgi:CII-binding regulator of phage lambda lysogenization HflD